MCVSSLECLHNLRSAPWVDSFFALPCGRTTGINRPIIAVVVSMASPPLIMTKPSGAATLAPPHSGNALRGVPPLREKLISVGSFILGAAACFRADNQETRGDRRRTRRMITLVRCRSNLVALGDRRQPTTCPRSAMNSWYVQPFPAVSHLHFVRRFPQSSKLLVILMTRELVGPRFESRIQPKQFSNRTPQRQDVRDNPPFLASNRHRVAQNPDTFSF